MSSSAALHSTGEFFIVVESTCLLSQSQESDKGQNSVSLQFSSWLCRRLV